MIVLTFSSDRLWALMASRPAALDTVQAVKRPDRVEMPDPGLSGVLALDVDEDRAS